MKTRVQELVIEITRQCNMSCSHCLRGDAENVNLDIKHVEKLFSKLEYIGNLTITGGEPSLHPEIIEQIVDVAEQQGVGIGSFYMVTNAKKVTPEFMQSILRLYSYCDDIDPEISGGIAISGDGYHDELNKDNVKMLEAFSFTTIRNDDGSTYDENLVNEGRAVDNYWTTRELNIYPFEIYDNEIGEHELYLNCYGDLLPECNLSYESQANKNLIIANVHDKYFNLINAVKRHNKKVGDGKIITDLCDMETA